MDWAEDRPQAGCIGLGMQSMQRLSAALRNPVNRQAAKCMHALASTLPLLPYVLLLIPPTNRCAAERRLSISSNYSRASEMVFGKDALLGPRRPRPHKIWKKKYIKVGQRRRGWGVGVCMCGSQEPSTTWV